MRSAGRICVLFIPVLSCFETVRNYSVQLCIVWIYKEEIQLISESKVKGGSILTLLLTVQLAADLPFSGCQ